MHVSPYLLFQYMTAVAGGLFVIGLSVLTVVFLGALVIGWARRPVSNS